MIDASLPIAIDVSRSARCSAAGGSAHHADAVVRLREVLGRVGAHFDIGPHHEDGKAAYDYQFVNGKMSAMHGQVFRGHIGGDKFSAKAPSNKTHFYARHLARWASAPGFSILEIGVFRGESLATWEGVFCNATVTGVDGNLRPFFAHLPTLKKLCRDRLPGREFSGAGARLYLERACRRVS